MIRSARRLRLTWLDAAILVALGLFFAYTAYRVTTVLTYHWNWSVVPRYVIRWDDDSKSWVSNLLLDGLLTTIRIMVWGSTLTSMIGLVMGLSRVSTSFFLRYVSGLYVNLVRNAPPLVFVFIFYYFISGQIVPLLALDQVSQRLSPTGQNVLAFFFGNTDQFSDFVSGVVALSIFEGAYLTEIIRAGIQAVEPGQTEASFALGLSRWQALLWVVLPQACKKMAPALTGQFISLIKDSTIVSLISIPELAFRGNQVTASTGAMFEVWLTVAGFYLVLCLGIGRFFKHVSADSGRPRSGRYFNMGGIAQGKNT